MIFQEKQTLKRNNHSKYKLSNKLVGPLIYATKPRDVQTVMAGFGEKKLAAIHLGATRILCAHRRSMFRERCRTFFGKKFHAGSEMNIQYAATNFVTLSEVSILPD